VSVEHTYYILIWGQSILEGAKKDDPSLWIRSPASQSASPYPFERREPRAHDVVIDIEYSGICHSDIHQVNNRWGASTFPMVPRHEITGIVSQVGTRVTRYKVGDRAAVGNFVDSCRRCRHCQKGLEQYCVEGATWTYNSVRCCWQDNGDRHPIFNIYKNNALICVYTSKIII
jgi:D-arabinose 1-dehydrogenase-like Zn-dependent alcohol dehydrogenase